MATALTNHQALTGVPGHCAAAKAPAVPPHPAFKGKLVIVTDAACFSSCLLMVERFRELGAIQLGQPTNAATHYMEVRAEDLPSGLGQFSTLQKAAPSLPARIGPFTPQVAYDGNISDTEALKAWVLKRFDAE